MTKISLTQLASGREKPLVAEDGRHRRSWTSTSHVRSLTRESHRELVSEVLRAGGRMWVRGRGPSMLPTIRPGERVLLEPLSSRLRKGDIVAVRAHRCILVHRVVECTVDTITTCGDASPRADAPSPRSSILGVATAVIRRGRVVGLTRTLRHGFVALALGELYRWRRQVGSVARSLR
jgi:hypothetical protein